MFSLERLYPSSPVEVSKSQTKIWSKKIHGSEKILGLKTFDPKKLWVQKNLGPNKFNVWKFFRKQLCLKKKIRKNFVFQKKICVWKKNRKNLGSGKKFGVWKKIWRLRKFLVQNNFGFKIFFVSNIIAGPKMLGPKKFWVCKIFCVQKKFGFKEIWSKNILAHKNYEPQKIGSKKFGQNQTSNSWDIADMDKRCQGIRFQDKYRQDICCLDKCLQDSWHLLKMVPGTYL